MHFLSAWQGRPINAIWHQLQWPYPGNHISQVVMVFRAVGEGVRSQPFIHPFSLMGHLFLTVYIFLLTWMVLMCKCCTWEWRFIHQCKLFKYKSICISLISDLGRKQQMDSLPSCVGRSWCISWTLRVKSLLWGSNQHNNLYFHLNHYPWSQDLQSKLHFWIINLKQVHPELQEAHFGFTWDRQSRSLTTKDWSNISTTSIYYTTDMVANSNQFVNLNLTIVDSCIVLHFGQYNPIFPVSI